MPANTVSSLTLFGKTTLFVVYNPALLHVNLRTKNCAKL